MGFEVIVVGGGPGGSTTAWRLARAGLRVLVLDAAVFPRVKICAGWVTPEALGDLEIDPEKYPLTIKPFEACVLEFEGGGTRRRGRARRATASSAASSITTCSSARPPPAPTCAGASASPPWSSARMAWRW